MEPTTLQLTATATDYTSDLRASPDGTDAPKLRTFSMLAYTGVAMRPRGFRSGPPVIVDIAGMTIPRQDTPVLRDHDPSRVVAHTEGIETSSRGIRVKGVVSGVGPDAEEVKQLAANGFPWQVSIGASIESLQYVDSQSSVLVNGRRVAGPVYVARATTLREVSFVSVGADVNTSATIKASGATIMTFEQWLEARGLKAADLVNDSIKAALQAAFDAEQKPKPAPVPQIDTDAMVKAATDAVTAAAAAEQTRIAEIRRICAQHGDPVTTLNVGTDKAQIVDIAAHAIASKWDVQRTELEILRESRPKVVAGRPGSDDTSVDMLAAALMLRNNLSFDSRHYQSVTALHAGLPRWLRAGMNSEQKQKAMEAAHAFSEWHALDFAKAALKLDGRAVPRSRVEMIQAAFSGSSLTQVFTTSVNAALLASYMEASDTTRGWTTEEDVNDFKTQDRPRVLVGDGLTVLPRGSTADHADWADVNESYKIARFAKQFVVDEQDMIDDNMGVFADTPKRFGDAAARLRPDLVYYIILSNPTLAATNLALFSDSNTPDNLVASTALSAANLRVAVQNMLLVQENDVNLNLRPTHLLVPPSRSELAWELTQSGVQLYGGDDEAIRGASNPLQRHGLVNVTDARLENGVNDPVTGTAASGSASSWYLLSTQAHTIVVAYRKGTGRAPTLRSFVLTQGQWGMGWDINLDIGAKALDHKGMIKFTE